MNLFVLWWRGVSPSSVKRKGGSIHGNADSFLLVGQVASSIHHFFSHFITQSPRENEM
jgi:hypothetical protein